MVGVKIKEDGFIAWSYKWMTTRDELPQSLCKLFWTVVFSWVMMVIFSPVMIPLLCFSVARKEPHNVGSLATVALTGIGCLSAMLVHGIYITPWLEVLINTLVVVGSAVVVTGSFFCIGWVCTKIIGKFRGKFRKEPTLAERYAKLEREQDRANKPIKADGFLKLGWKAFMGKYCPKVDWV